jgi:hypothetical protein
MVPARFGSNLELINAGELRVHYGRPLYSVVETSRMPLEMVIIDEEGPATTVCIYLLQY